MEDLQWYKKFLLNEHNTLNEDEDHNQGRECICMEEDIGDIKSLRHLILSIKEFNFV